MSAPNYVRLVERLNRGIVADVAGGTGWSIAGLDVKEVPDEAEDYRAHLFVLAQLRQGHLEAATAGEYQDVQDANDAIAEAGAFDPDAGESINEAAIQAAARKAAKELSQAAAARQAKGNEDEDEFDGKSRDDLVALAAEDYGVELAKNISRVDALAAVRAAAAE